MLNAKSGQIPKDVFDSIYIVILKGKSIESRTE